MKRAMFLLSVLVLVAFVAGATTAQAGATKGLKAGLTMSTFTGADKTMAGVDPSYKMGLAFGGYMNYAIGPKLSFQPEALYAMKGAKYEDGGDKVTLKMNYLAIPLLLKLQPTPGSGVFFVAGPELAFKLSAKMKDEVNGTSDMTDVKSMDYGLALGIGADLSKISLEGRYTMGLTSVDDSTDPSKIKNSGFMFLVGMGF